MRATTRVRSLAIAVAGCFTLAVALPHPDAAAAPRPQTPVAGNAALAQAQAQTQTGGQYFIEFRARHSILGHAYIVYGRLGAAGVPIELHYAGNQPADHDYGAYIGAVVPVPGVIRSVPEDFKAEPTTVYHRRLSAVEYRHVTMAIARIRAREHAWHLLFYNCNDFTVEIAHSLGMVSPPFPWMPPDAMVTGLRLLNSR